MIFTERTITIRNDSASINTPVILYRGDKNVEVRFTLVESPYKYSNRDSVNIIESTDAAYAQLIIKTPNDRDPIFGDITAVGQSNIIFVIEYGMIDEIGEVGEYDFQIRLFDSDQTSMVTLPEVVSGFIIKEPIAKENATNNITNSAIVDSAVVTNDTEIPTFVSGSYNKTTWSDGDVISKQKLNKLEDSIYETYELSKVNNSQIKDKANKNEIFSMANMGQDIKEAMTGGSVAVVGANSILRENLQNNSISPNKTTFLEHDDTTNIVDKKLIYYGGYINPNNGDVIEKIGWYITDFLEIEPNVLYYRSGLYGAYCAGYDANLNFIKGWNESNPLPNSFTIEDENIKYLRFTILNENNLAVAKLTPHKGQINECSYKLDGIKIFNDDIVDINGYKIRNGTIANNKIEMMKFDLNNVQFEENKYVYIGNGKIQDLSGNYASDYIDVKLISSINIINYSAKEMLNYLKNFGVVFYDINKKMIGSVGYDTSNNMTINIPSECAYIKFTSVHNLNNTELYINGFIEAHKDKLIEHETRLNTSENDISKIKAEIGQEIQNPIEYKHKEISIFNKCLCIGDSLTAGVFNHNESGSTEYVQISKYSYPTYITKLCGLETVNWGMGGNTTKSWYEAKSGDSWSGYDMSIINLGANDAKITVTESKEYLQKIVNKLKDENEGIKIFIATLLPAYYTTNKSFFTQINDNIKDIVTNNTNCYLVDLSKYSECQENTVYAQGHLTALGYLKEANELIAYISYIISKNMNEFKYVQFIGTNYSHS